LSNVSTLTNTGIIVGTGTYIQTANEFAVNSQTINNGSLTQSSVIINGGTLRGTGTITANVTIGSEAIVAPGNPFGTLTINGAFASSGKRDRDRRAERRAIRRAEDQRQRGLHRRHDQH